MAGVARASRPEFGLDGVAEVGHQEGAEVGYNPDKPDLRSFDPPLAVLTQMRLCPATGSGRKTL